MALELSKKKEIADPAEFLALKQVLEFEEY